MEAVSKTGQFKKNPATSTFSLILCDYGPVDLKQQNLMLH